jgi:hypothetical protein
LRRVVLRRLLTTAAVAALFAAAPLAESAEAAQRSLLMPGVSYERQVEFTSHGPVAIHVLRAPKPGGLYALRPVLSNGAVLGRERVTAMQRAISPVATAAGVNGDLFTWADGRPTGIFMQARVLASPPSDTRSSAGVTADGTLRVQRLKFFGTWRGSGQRRPLTVNQPPGPNGAALYTPQWGPTTPPQPGSVEAVLQPFPPAVPDGELVGNVVVHSQGGNSGIPADGAVLVTRGTTAQRLLAEAPVGAPVAIRLQITPDWSDVQHAVGGGPVLVRDGKPVFRHFELFSPSQLARNPRTAVGQLADGRVVLVVVDGRQPGYSAGMTNFELAQTMVRLGAVAAMGLDAGGSSTMAFDGTLLNRPSDRGGEREVAEGLFVLYEGAYVAPPREPVLSPNGDGVGEAQSFSYKLVRQSHVVVKLLGPGRVERILEEADKPAGTYPLAWNGSTPQGGPEAEGNWRLSVSATDDLGRSSAADRVFSLNRTLGQLSVAPRLFRVRPTGTTLRATFTLARPATVVARVETLTGAVITNVTRARLPAGARSIRWAGRVGRRTLVHTGRYVLRVIATNPVGRMDLAQPFTARRVASPRGPTPRG